MPSKFTDFIEETLAARGLKKRDLAEMIGVEPEKIYDLLENAKNGHCPRADIAKAVEKALGIQNLDPSYYGWGSPIKVCEK
jgi:ribosome-binding protein aMBF1 (putative translation factor)